MKKYLKLVPLVALLNGVIPALRAADGPPASNIVREVRHELLSLSLYGVFDNIAYRVDGTRVSLFGQVTNPVLKTDAEKAVKHIEGVTGVDDEIEVLPPSSMDDGTRRRVYQAIYGDPALSRYSFQAVPSI